MLSDIDVQHAMKEKLRVDLPPYRIIVACSPPLAHPAPQAVPDLGLLLPCNVIVRGEAPERVVARFLDPPILVNLVVKSEAKTVAETAEQDTSLHPACRARNPSCGPRRPCGESAWIFLRGDR